MIYLVFWICIGLDEFSFVECILITLFEVYIVWILLNHRSVKDLEIYGLSIYNKTLMFEHLLGIHEILLNHRNVKDLEIYGLSI